MKQSSYFVSNFVRQNSNQCIKNSKFPSNLKLADLTPSYKKKSRTSKDTYRPTSILPNVSKIYERCIYNQIQQYFDNILSKYQCGSHKGCNLQHYLIKMIEKWRGSADKGSAFDASIIDLSKAFDCFPHELLITKLHAYDFDMKSLNLIYDYLFNRK